MPLDFETGGNDSFLLAPYVKTFDVLIYGHQVAHLIRTEASECDTSEAMRCRTRADPFRIGELATDVIR